MHKLVHAWGCDRLSDGEERELSLAALGLLTGFPRISDTGVTVSAARDGQLWDHPYRAPVI
jgi:hypothetical protein